MAIPFASYKRRQVHQEELEVESGQSGHSGKSQYMCMQYVSKSDSSSDSTQTVLGASPDHREKLRAEPQMRSNGQ